jgi:hypothetical protein
MSSRGTCVELREGYNRGELIREKFMGFAGTRLGDWSIRSGWRGSQLSYFSLLSRHSPRGNNHPRPSVNPPYQFIGLSMKLEKYLHIRHE